MVRLWFPGIILLLFLLGKHNTYSLVFLNQIRINYLLFQSFPYIMCILSLLFIIMYNLIYSSKALINRIYYFLIKVYIMCCSIFTERFHIINLMSCHSLSYPSSIFETAQNYPFSLRSVHICDVFRLLINLIRPNI